MASPAVIDQPQEAPNDVAVASGAESPLQGSTRPTTDINRLSAVPSSGMVRGPTTNTYCFDKEETRANKRSSSVGNAFRRLFSKSPAPPERSSSETQHTSETAKRRGQRGHTPPRNPTSPNTSGSISEESSTLPPNNLFYRPPTQNIPLGGLLNAQQVSLDPHRTAMASHRGLDYGQPGGSWRDQATVIRNSGAPAPLPSSQSVSHVSQQYGEIRSHADVPFSLASVRHSSRPIGEIRSHDVRFDDFQGTNDNDNNVIVHYAVPTGTRYLPVVLNDTVTMMLMGQHDGQSVFEPINTFLQSPEDGLRFHRTMNANDMYEGSLDLARFGRPVVGPLSNDENWLVNPLPYDPTRPSVRTQNSENYENAIPIIDAVTLGPPPSIADAISIGAAWNPEAVDPSSSAVQAVDISLMAEFGSAVTR